MTIRAVIPCVVEELPTSSLHSVNCLPNTHNSAIFGISIQPPNDAALPKCSMYTDAKDKSVKTCCHETIPWEVIALLVYQRQGKNYLFEGVSDEDVFSFAESSFVACAPAEEIISFSADKPQNRPGASL